MRITFETTMSKEQFEEAIKHIHRLVLGSTPSRMLLTKHDICLQALNDLQDNQVTEREKNDWWLE